MRPKTATEWIESRRIKYTAEEKAMLFEAVNAGLQMAIECAKNMEVTSEDESFAVACAEMQHRIAAMKK